MACSSALGPVWPRIYDVEHQTYAPVLSVLSKRLVHPRRAWRFPERCRNAEPFQARRERCRAAAPFYHLG